jgi:hypothetical protein
VTRAQINGPVLHAGESEQTGILSMPRRVEIESKHGRLSRPFISSATRAIKFRESMPHLKKESEEKA